MPPRLLETELYPPLKAFLEAQGYAVKGEIAGADIVAIRGEDDPVIVEMKTGFSLALFHQAVDRQGVSDWVYVAAPHPEGRGAVKALKANTALCRRLGLGLLTVRLRDGFVSPLLDPTPYRPRPSIARKTRLLREFARREGDPNLGGVRSGVVTAYRQDAMKVAALLAAGGPLKAALVAERAGVPRARAIMADDHYGWFERVERGVYQLTPRGRAETGA